jgi:hypothetical protein
VIENTLSIAAIVPGMAKENSKMGCVFLNEIHSLRTNSNISDHRSQVVRDFVFHSSILILFASEIRINSYDTYQFFKNLCMVKGAKTFTTVDSHFVRAHENFSSCNLLITEDVQSMGRKEWLCFIVWNANSPSSAVSLVK